MPSHHNYSLSPDVVVEAVGFEFLVLHKSTGAVQRLEGRSAVALREVMSGRDPHLMGLGDVLEILVDLRIVMPAAGRVSRRKLLGLSAAAAGVGIVTITMPQAAAALSTDDDDLSALVAPEGYVTFASTLSINGQSVTGGFGFDRNEEIRTDGYFYRSAHLSGFGTEDVPAGSVRLTVVGGSGGRITPEAGGRYDSNGGIPGRGAVVIAVTRVGDSDETRALSIWVGDAGSGSSFGDTWGAPANNGASGITNFFHSRGGAGGGYGDRGGGGGGAASGVLLDSAIGGGGISLVAIAGGGGGAGGGTIALGVGGAGGHGGRAGGSGEARAGGGGVGGFGAVGGAAGSPTGSFVADPQYAPAAGVGRPAPEGQNQGSGGQGGGAGMASDCGGGGGGGGYAGGGGGGDGSTLSPTGPGGGGGGGSSWSSDGAAGFGLRGSTGNGYVRVQFLPDS